MQAPLQRELEHGELEAKGQLVGEVDGDEIKLLGVGHLAEVVEGRLGERAGGDDVVGSEEARGRGGEGGSGGGGGVYGEGDAGVLPEGLRRGGAEAAAVEGGGGGERERGEWRDGLDAAAVGIGEQAAVGMVESDGGIPQLEGAGG